jgi:glycosyltransferase involved in cell wall biosynthesis
MIDSFKSSFKPKLSVITIVYNNVSDIERTMLSVINQSYESIEYIIIDGASTDGTVDIIKKYEDRISFWISEKDKGIYNAMNKGLEIAKGDYVLFMNSGDEIYDSLTVEKVFASSPNADIYYGETEMYDENWDSLGKRRHKIPDKFTWRSFKYGMNISHQAIYIKKSITTPYNEKYQLSADIDWIITAAKKANTIVNVQDYVAKYLVGGISKKRHRQSLKERFKIFSNYYGFLPNLFNHGVIVIKLGWYYLKHRKTND